jgi:hypothetical protein
MWPVVVYSNKLRLKEDDGSNNEKRNGMRLVEKKNSDGEYSNLKKTNRNEYGQGGIFGMIEKVDCIGKIRLAKTTRVYGHNFIDKDNQYTGAFI